MKGLRLLLAAVFVLAVVLEGWSGVVVGGSLVAIGELVALRWRLAGAPGSFAGNAGLRSFRHDLSGAGRRLLRRRGKRQQEPDFPGLQREYDFGSLRGFDLVLRFRLADAAAVRLSERRGVDMFADSTRARALLGEDVWQFLDPGRPTASHAEGGRVSRRQVAKIVRAIEGL